MSMWLCRFMNRLVPQNSEQKTAVEHIVCGTSRPAPYLIYGPPGTGKTFTLVEAIKQVSQFSTIIIARVCCKFRLKKLSLGVLNGKQLLFKISVSCDGPIFCLCGSQIDGRVMISSICITDEVKRSVLCGVVKKFIWYSNMQPADNVPDGSAHNANCTII